MSQFPFSMNFVLYDLCHPAFEKGRDKPNGKGEVLVKCPHTGKEFEVNLNKETWNCFRECACCPAKGMSAEKNGGILGLYKVFFGSMSNSDAYRCIMDAMQGNPGLAKMRMDTKPKPKETVPRLPDEELDKTYRAFLNNLTLSKEHRTDLLARGFDDEDIKKMGFRSLPQSGLNVIGQSLQARGCKIEGVPGFYTRYGKPEINCAGSGYFIPYRNETGLIVGLQVRYDVKITPEMDEDEVKQAKMSRYRWFSSSSKTHGAAAKNVPFYGVPGMERKDAVYVTEGGLKAAAASVLSDGWFIAIPGVLCYDSWRELLEFLKTQNIKHLIDAFDSDRETNPQVARAISKLHAIARSYGFEMVHWDWGTEQKGVDDYLLALKKKRAEQENIPLPPIPKK